MWNWFWGIKAEEAKRRPQAPPDYARPTLLIYTYGAKTAGRPSLDVEFDISTDDGPDSVDNRDLPQLLERAIRQINKRLAKLAEEWEHDRQLSQDMAAGDEDFYNDETMGGKIMRSTVDVAGGSAPKLRVGCMSNRKGRAEAFGEMLEKHEWPTGWVVKLKHCDAPLSAKQAQTSARNAMERGLAPKLGDQKPKKPTTADTQDFLGPMKF